VRTIVHARLDVHDPAGRAGDDMTGFPDLFSSHAACYARARPGYPPELFDYLASLSPRRRLAWDAGTGNGQAAVGLAAHFERVVATDASAGQLAHARPHERILYHVAAAELSGLDAASVDLVTVAQALHWINHDAFYAEVRRVAAPGGLIAAWCYTLPRVDARIDGILDRFYHDVTGPYWEAGRRWIDERYETIPYPFNELRARPHPDPSRDAPPRRGPPASRERQGTMAAQPPGPSDSPQVRREVGDFLCRAEWSLADYLAYIESWSAVQAFRRRNDRDPLDAIRGDLAAAWYPADGRRGVTWPIHLRVGRVASGPANG